MRLGALGAASDLPWRAVAGTGHSTDARAEVRWTCSRPTPARASVRALCITARGRTDGPGKSLSAVSLCKGIRRGGSLAPQPGRGVCVHVRLPVRVCGPLPVPQPHVHARAGAKTCAHARSHRPGRADTDRRTRRHCAGHESMPRIAGCHPLLKQTPHAPLAAKRRPHGAAWRGPGGRPAACCCPCGSGQAARRRSAGRQRRAPRPPPREAQRQEQAVPQALLQQVVVRRAGRGGPGGRQRGGARSPPRGGESFRVAFRPGT